MGCDYYVYTTVVVTFDDDSIAELESSRQECWFDSNYDSDDESSNEASQRELEKCSETVPLYQNGRWLIKNKEKVARYDEKISQSNSGKTVISVERIKYGVSRA